MKIKIVDVRFIKELYPRFELDNYTVNQYRQSIDQLPPILISNNNILIDGYHRIQAHKLEELDEIEYEIFDTEDEKEILLEAIRRNSTHGKQLAIEEKRKLAPKLYSMGISLVNIQDILSIGKTKVYDWTQNLRDKETDERNAEIIELYLQCWSLEEIAEKFDKTHPTISSVVKKSINGKTYIPDNLELYNVWSVGRLDPDQLKYPGQTPLSIVENLVYYYTSPPQTESLSIAKVLDPMAGSGIVRDACRNLMRRYMMYDINPLREDIPIHQNDILQGFPDKAKGTDFVYFDPPYFNLMSEYPDNDFTKDYESFIGAMETSLKNIKAILKKGGKVALVLKPMNEKMMEGEWLDMTIDCVTIAKSLGYKLIKRICAPLSTQQFQAHDVSRIKESKVMLNTLRDIVILEA